MNTTGLYKCRTLALADARAVELAAALLSAGGYACLALPAMHRLVVSYALPEHTLERAVALVAPHGLLPPAGSLQAWHLKLILFAEGVQLSNLDTPVPDTKGRQAFSRIYQHHPHGDHDDTPEELRRER